MFLKKLFLLFIICFCIQLASESLAQEKLSFSEPIRLSAGNGTRYIVKGDFDKNGNVDFAVTNEDGIAVFLNQGKGIFKESAKIPVNAPRAIVAGDFSGDTYLDLVAISTDTGEISFFFNQKEGTFQKGPQYIDFAPSSIVSGDLDGDNNLDLVIASEKANAVMGVLQYPNSPLPRHPNCRMPSRIFITREIDTSHIHSKIFSERITYSYWLLALNR